MMNVYIEITPNEAIAIDHLCKNEHFPMELFLQMGQIILSGEPTRVSISEGDLWKIRETVPYAYMIGKEPVGLTLKHKVYKCLLDMDLEREIGIPVSSTEEPRFNKEGLVEWKSPDYYVQRKGGDQCL